MASATSIEAFNDLWREGRFRKKILTEGDTWVHHPEIAHLSTQLEQLDPEQYLVLNTAWPGDTAQEMLMPCEVQLERLRRVLDNRQFEQGFDLIVFSAGGSDWVGEQLAAGTFLVSYADNPNAEPKSRLKPAFREQLDRVTECYRAALQLVRQSRFNAATPVITHSYCYLQPCKKGRPLFGWPVQNGWIATHMEQTYGIDEPDYQRQLMNVMVDAFYDAVKPLEEEFEQFMVADLRPVLVEDGMPRAELWFDEFHPNDRGFQLLARALREQAVARGLWAD